jgi:hypothetical protein
MGHEDPRQQLCNEQETGPFFKVQLPLERITRLHGILWDLDPKHLAAGNPIFPPADDPKAFYELVRPVLDRHPLARTAEVRVSGTGLHLIVWLRPAVEFRSAADQHRWDHIVSVVQRTLPADPRMPGITALTRPVGSVNSKNGATVETLRAGDPIEPGAVEEFVGRLVRAPFREVALILLGSERFSPCPVCQAEGSRLDILDHVGMCYGRCGKVKGSQLYDVIYRPVEKPRKTASRLDQKAGHEHGQGEGVPAKPQDSALEADTGGRQQ